MSYDLNYYDKRVMTEDDGYPVYYSDWYSEFLFYPRIFNKRLHWFKTVYWRTNYSVNKFEYKTRKQFIIDELRGKN